MFLHRNTKPQHGKGATHWCVLLGLLALASCNGGNRASCNLIVDLNRTASSEAILRPALVPTDSAKPRTVMANAMGAYVVPTDSLPTGLYVMEWDSAHTLPLMIRQGENQKVLGTWQTWHSLRFSDAESEALQAVESLRARAAAATDTVCQAFAVGKNVRARAAGRDSLARSLGALRLKADELLNQYDTSLVALPILSIHGLYDPVRDAEMMGRVLGAVGNRHPEFAQVRERQQFVERACRLQKLRKLFATGAQMPLLTFCDEHGDTTSLLVAPRRPMALAFFADSASRSMENTILSITARRGLALVEAPVHNVGPAGVSISTVLYGRFVNLEGATLLREFAPALVELNPDGTVARLLMGPKAQRQ